MTNATTSWKTSITGIILAGLIVLQKSLADGVAITDLELWIAVAIAALGILARDGDKSSQDHKIRPE